MKFSIVTPVYNGEKYIAETIKSVLNQAGDFGVEYIIMDGGSTDRTLEIAYSYKKQIDEGNCPIKCKGVSFFIFSEKDSGMYDAIEKGFARATGDIYAYINADDKYLAGAFAAVASIFTPYSDIEWLKGINTTGDENGNIISQGSCLLYRRAWLAKGIYGRSAYFVHQDSVFWRQSLWKKAHLAISSFRLAGDYALWIAFAKHAPLLSFNKRVSMFRKCPGQLSASMNAYRREQEKIAPHNFFLEKRTVLFFSLKRFLGLNPKSITTRILFFALFPFHKQEWYIDFDAQNTPIKKKSVSYLV